MNEDISGLNQRVALLRKHIREWKANNQLEVQARQEIYARHQKHKNDASSTTPLSEWLQIITAYEVEMSDLAEGNYVRQDSIRSRQDQQITELEGQIKATRSRQGGSRHIQGISAT